MWNIHCNGDAYSMKLYDMQHLTEEEMIEYLREENSLEPEDYELYWTKD